MSSISEFSYQELADLDVALLPERETMFGIALAAATASAGGHFAASATYTDASVVTFHHFSIADSTSLSAAVSG